jgi:hypothetical protein
VTLRRSQSNVLGVLPLARAALAVAFVLFLSRAASAQAFVPPAGEGNVTVAYQDLFTRGHLDLNGERMAGPSGTDRTRAHAMTLEGEFGVTDRLAVYGSIPFIRSRYEGSAPHLVGGVPGAVQEWDDGHYHGTWQDVHLGLRFNIVARPVAITAFAERVIPSHQYPATAHAAVGKDLLALTVGGAVGGFLDGVLPGLFFQSQYSYTRTAEIVGIRPNRSRVDGEVGYFITPRLAVRFLESYQVTHDGFDLVGFLPMTDARFHRTGEDIPASLRHYHDQLQRSNFLTLGAGVGFAVNESVEIFAAGSNTVWGENVHPLRGVTIGANMHFRTRSSSHP